MHEHKEFLSYDDSILDYETCIAAQLDGEAMARGERGVIHSVFFDIRRCEYHDHRTGRKCRGAAGTEHHRHDRTSRGYDSTHDQRRHARHRGGGSAIQFSAERQRHQWWLADFFHCQPTELGEL